MINSNSLLAAVGSGTFPRNPWQTEGVKARAFAEYHALRPAPVARVGNSYFPVVKCVKFNGYWFAILQSTITIAGQLYRFTDATLQNGVAVTLSGANTSFYVTDIAVFGGKLFASDTNTSGYATATRVSSDGLTFTLLASDFGRYFLNNGSGRLYAVNNTAAAHNLLKYTTDGVNVLSITLPTTAFWQGIAGSGNNVVVFSKYQAITSAPTLCYSTNGLDFTNSADFANLIDTLGLYRAGTNGAIVGVAGWIADVVWAVDKFVMTIVYGGHLFFYSSPTGQTWTYLSKVTFEQDRVVAASGAIPTSYATRTNQNTTSLHTAYTRGMWLNGQYIFKVRLFRPERGQTVAGTGEAIGGTVLTKLVRTSDFVHFNEMQPFAAVAMGGGNVAMNTVTDGGLLDGHVDSVHSAYNCGVAEIPDFGLIVHDDSILRIATFSPDLVNAKEICYAV